MIRSILCMLLVGCVDTAEPAEPALPPPVVAHVITPPPALPQLIDLSNDVVVIEVDYCDDPSHSGDCHDSDDDLPPEVGVKVAIDDAHAGDRDGVPDVRDKCPDAPEDIDGFEDTDSCPEVVHDRDVVDVQDRCPDVPDDEMGDIDGCPDPAT